MKIFRNPNNFTKYVFIITLSFCFFSSYTVNSLKLTRNDFRKSVNCSLNIQVNGNNIVGRFRLTALSRTSNGYFYGNVVNSFLKEDIIITYGDEINDTQQIAFRVSNKPVNLFFNNRWIFLELVSPACRNRKFDLTPSFEILIKSSVRKYCKDPGNPKDGYRIFRGTNFRIGSQIQFYCSEGHRLQGAKSAECVHNLITNKADWSNRLPECIAECPQLNPPKFGKLVESRQGNNSFVKVSCWKPFVLKGEGVLKCGVGANGKPNWDKNIPRCILGNCENQIVLAGRKAKMISIDNIFKKITNKFGCHLLEIRTFPGHIIELSIQKLQLPNRTNFKIFDNDGNDIFKFRNNTNYSYLKFILTDNVFIYYKLDVNDHVTDQYDDTGLILSYVAKTVTKTLIFRKRKLAELPQEDDEATISPTTSKLSDGSGGNPDNHAGIIAAGVIVPVFLLSVIGIIVYVWYRKKYPVRMIIGKDFGKFTNPTYEKRASTLTLVREDGFDAAYKKDIEAGAASKEVSTHDEEVDYINEEQYQPTNISYGAHISMGEVPGQSPEVSQKQNKKKDKANKKDKKGSKMIDKLKGKTKGKETSNIAYVDEKENEDQNNMIENAEQMISSLRHKVKAPNIEFGDNETSDSGSSDVADDVKDQVDANQAATDIETEKETQKEEKQNTHEVDEDDIKEDEVDIDFGEVEIVETDKIVEKYSVENQEEKLGGRAMQDDVVSEDEMKVVLRDIEENEQKSRSGTATTTSNEDIVTDLDESFGETSDHEPLHENSAFAKTVKNQHDDVKDDVKDQENGQGLPLLADDRDGKVEDEDMEKAKQDMSIENRSREIDENSEDTSSKESSSENSFVVLSQAEERQNEDTPDGHVLPKSESDNQVASANETESVELELNSVEKDENDEIIDCMEENIESHLKGELTVSALTESEFLNSNDDSYEILQNDEYVIKSNEEFYAYPPPALPVQDPPIKPDVFQTDGSKIAESQPGGSVEDKIANDAYLRSLSYLSVVSDPGAFRTMLSFDSENVEDRYSMDLPKYNDSELSALNRIAEDFETEPDSVQTSSGFEILDKGINICSSSDHSSLGSDVNSLQDMDSDIENTGKPESASMENLFFDSSFKTENVESKRNQLSVTPTELLPSISMTETVPSSKRKNIAIDKRVKFVMEDSDSDSNNENSGDDIPHTYGAPALQPLENVTSTNPFFDFDEQNVVKDETENKENFVIIDPQDGFEDVSTAVSNITVRDEATYTEPAAIGNNEKQEEEALGLGLEYNQDQGDESRKKITLNFADINDSDTTSSDTDSDSSHDGDEGSYTIQQNEDSSEA